MKYTLRELRARNKESQTLVAEALNVHINTYVAWERDLSNVGVENVYKLAAHFNVHIDEISFR